MDKQVDRNIPTQTERETKNRTQKPTDMTDKKAPEIGGYDGPEPTRYGDWEKNGRCIDF